MLTLWLPFTSPSTLLRTASGIATAGVFPPLCDLHRRATVPGPLHPALAARVPAGGGQQRRHRRQRYLWLPPPRQNLQAKPYAAGRMANDSWALGQ